MKVYFDVSKERQRKLNGEALIAAEEFAAGEIPTLKGMRAFVTCLMNHEDGTPIPQEQAERIFNKWDTDQIKDAFKQLNEAIEAHAAPKVIETNSMPTSITTDVLPAGLPISTVPVNGGAHPGHSELMGQG